MGIVKTKSLARSYFWWPSMNKEIEDLINKCDSCISNKALPPKISPKLWPFPDKVWSRIHIDFCGPFLDSFFLIIIDARSKWLEAFVMKSITTNKTIEILQHVFARYGFPEVVVSDNGTSFVSFHSFHF